MEHINSLDYLRAGAASLVLFGHTHFNISHLEPNWVDSGQFAVRTFMVLSGFLIVRGLISAHGSSGAMAKFFINRSSRIFPAYFLMLGILMLSGIPVSGYIWAYLSNINMMDVHQSLKHTWSLSIEEQYYLIVPFIILLLPARYAAASMMLIIAFALAWVANKCYWSGFRGTLIVGINFGTISNSVFFAVGGLMAAYEKFFRSNNGLRLCTYTMVAIIAIRVAQYPLGVSNAEIFIYYLIGIGMSFLTVGIFINDSFNKWILKYSKTLAPIGYMGSISYGLYLYHYPIYYMLNAQHDQNYVSGWNTVLAIVLTFMIAVISFHYFETPIRKYFRRN